MERSSPRLARAQLASGREDVRKPLRKKRCAQAFARDGVDRYGRNVRRWPLREIDRPRDSRSSDRVFLVSKVSPDHLRETASRVLARRALPVSALIISRSICCTGPLGRPIGRQVGISMAWAQLLSSCFPAVRT